MGHTQNDLTAAPSPPGSRCPVTGVVNQMAAEGSCVTRDGQMIGGPLSHSDFVPVPALSVTAGQTRQAT